MSYEHCFNYLKDAIDNMPELIKSNLVKLIIFTKDTAWVYRDKEFYKYNDLQRKTYVWNYLFLYWDMDKFKDSSLVRSKIDIDYSHILDKKDISPISIEEICTSNSEFIAVYIDLDRYIELDSL